MNSATITALDGHVASNDPLSPFQAIGGLPRASRAISHYTPENLWDEDTARLPKPLQIYRRKLKLFAQSTLRPAALSGDIATHLAAGETHAEFDQILSSAGKSGLLSDQLPAPWGTLKVAYFRNSLVLQSSLKTEELFSACAGYGLSICASGLGALPILLSGKLSTIRRFMAPAYKQSLQGNAQLFAFAITEPNAGSDAEESHGAKHAKPGVVATPCAGGWKLNGRKCFISGGDIATNVTLFAALEGEGMESWSCFLLEKGMPGFKAVRTELKMGQRASSVAELELIDVFVPKSHLVGELRQGWALNRATLNYSRMPVAAIALGIARGAMESAIGFACQYKIGGKTLINYQEIQLQIAQMIAETSAMRSMIWQNAAAITPRQGKASMSKFYCSDAAMRVCDMAMEILGNQGMLHKNNVEKCFRDARLTQIYEGTNQINRLAVIEEYQDLFLTLEGHKS